MQISHRWLLFFGGVRGCGVVDWLLTKAIGHSLFCHLTHSCEDKRWEFARNEEIRTHLSDFLRFSDTPCLLSYFQSSIAHNLRRPTDVTLHAAKEACIREKYSETFITPKLEISVISPILVSCLTFVQPVACSWGILVPLLIVLPSLVVS